MAIQGHFKVTTCWFSSSQHLVACQISMQLAMHGWVIDDLAILSIWFQEAPNLWMDLGYVDQSVPSLGWHRIVFSHQVCFSI